MRARNLRGYPSGVALPSARSLPTSKSLGHARGRSDWETITMGGAADSVPLWLG